MNAGGDYGYTCIDNEPSGSANENHQCPYPLYTYHSDNSEKYKWVFDGECSDGYEVRLEDVSGTQEERAEQCASKCASRENAHPSDSWTTGGVDIKRSTIQGFLIHRDYNYCWCETSLGTDCSRNVNNGYIRYDFTTPGVLVRMKIDSRKWENFVAHNLRVTQVLRSKSAWAARENSASRASIIGSSHVQHHDYVKAIDHDRVTYWEGAAKIDQFLQIDLRHSYFVKRVAVTLPIAIKNATRVVVTDNFKATSGQECNTSDTFDRVHGDEVVGDILHHYKPQFTEDGNMHHNYATDLSGALVKFDNGTNDPFATRDHSNTQYFGEQQWDIASNGGFSIVGTFKAKDAQGGFYERLLQFKAESGSSMSVVRHDKNEYFYIELFDPNGQACNSESHDGVHGLSVPTNQWVNLIWRYNAEKR